MEKMLSILFYARDYSHKQHLISTNYSDHMALNEFYDELIELVDDLSENYQGKYGRMKMIPLTNLPYKEDSSKELTRVVKWLENNRYEVIDKEDASLQAIVDEVVELFYSTLYKLNNFKSKK
jgi:hypothetical protein